MKKVLLTAAILFAGTLGFYSCVGDDIEPAEPTTNVGTQNPDDQKEPEKEPVKEEVDEEAATDELDPVDNGDGGSPSFLASFFKGENGEALISKGRSFHINYPLKNLESPFTTQSVSRELVRKETAPKTNVKMYYTSNDYEYNTLNTRNYSGSVGFLNIASISPARQEEMTSSTSENTERIIFVATADFGQYSYDKNLVLTKAANEYLKAGKFDEFKTKYGTHYVDGYDKVATIRVIASRKTTQSNNSSSISNELGAKVNYKGFKASFDYDDNQTIKKRFASNDVNVEVELEGPTFKKDELKNMILGMKGEDFISSVYEFLDGKVSELNDDSKAIITNYYVKSFALKGCKDINWTTEKENVLSTINENYLSTKRLINFIDDYKDKNTIDIVFEKYGFLTTSNCVKSFNNEFKYDFGCDIPSNSLNKMNESYKKGVLNEKWEALQAKANSLTSQLRSQYDLCYDVKFDIKNSSNDYSEETKALFNEFNQIVSIGEDAANEIFEDYSNARQTKEDEIEAEKDLIRAEITINNKSNNPYEIIVCTENFEQVYTFDLNGKKSKTIRVDPAYFTIQYKQLSGYSQYPTIDKKTLDAQPYGVYNVDVATGWFD